MLNYKMNKKNIYTLYNSQNNWKMFCTYLQGCLFKTIIFVLIVISMLIVKYAMPYIFEIFEKEIIKRYC